MMADPAAISEPRSAVVFMVPTSPPLKMKDDRTTGQLSVNENCLGYHTIDVVDLRSLYRQWPRAVAEWLIPSAVCYSPVVG